MPKTTLNTQRRFSVFDLIPSLILSSFLVSGLFILEHTFFGSGDLFWGLLCGGFFSVGPIIFFGKLFYSRLALARVQLEGNDVSLTRGILFKQTDLLGQVVGPPRVIVERKITSYTHGRAARPIEVQQGLGELPHTETVSEFHYALKLEGEFGTITVCEPQSLEQLRGFAQRVSRHFDDAPIVERLD